MVKDPRYKTIQKLILTDKLDSLAEILVNIPKTVIAKDVKQHHDTIQNYFEYPPSITIEFAIRFSNLIEVDPMIFLNLVYRECLAYYKAKNKK